MKNLDRQGILEHFEDKAAAYIANAERRAAEPFCLAHIPTRHPERMADAAWWLIQNRGRPKTAIDFGCGTGRMVKFFEVLMGVDKYVGVEQVEATFRQAQSWYAAETFINLAIQDLNPDDLPFAAPADLGFTHGVLMHVPPENIADVCANIRRLSKIQMIVEMTRQTDPATGWAPHVFKHNYHSLFGAPVYKEWLTPNKRIFIFEG